MVYRSSIGCVLAFLASLNFGLSQQQQDPWYVNYCLQTIIDNASRLGLNDEEEVEELKIYYRFDHRPEKVASNFYGHILPWYEFRSDGVSAKESPWLTVAWNEELVNDNPAVVLQVTGDSNELEDGDIFISFTGIVEEGYFSFIPVKLNYVGTNYSTDFYFVVRKTARACDIYAQTGIE